MVSFNFSRRLRIALNAKVPCTPEMEKRPSHYPVNWIPRFYGQKYGENRVHWVADQSTLDVHHPN
jgi:hypothetical protein